MFQGVQCYSGAPCADCGATCLYHEASADSFSRGLGVVAEGRDITTVVAPDAEVKSCSPLVKRCVKPVAQDSPLPSWQRKRRGTADKADSRSLISLPRLKACSP